MTSRLAAWRSRSSWATEHRQCTPLGLEPAAKSCPKGRPQAPRNDAPRPARTRLCRDSVGIRRSRAHHVGSRQAVPGGGPFCGGCDARPGGGRACALRQLTRRSCLSGAPFGARSEFCDADPRPSIAAESERSGDRHSMGPRRVPPAATRGSGSRGCRIESGMTMHYCRGLHLPCDPRCAHAVVCISILLNNSYISIAMAPTTTRPAKARPICIAEPAEISR